MLVESMNKWKPFLAICIEHLAVRMVIPHLLCFVWLHFVLSTAANQGIGKMSLQAIESLNPSALKPK